MSLIMLLTGFKHGRNKYILWQKYGAQADLMKTITLYPSFNFSSFNAKKLFKKSGLGLAICFKW